MSKTIYTVYKTCNVITEEYYIGVHKTKNPNDSYFGSGLRIKRSVAKYGKENFTKQVLFMFDDKQAAFSKEVELVDKHKTDILCLNLAAGSQGGALFTGKTHSIETRQKLSKAGKGRIVSDEARRRFSARKHTSETIEKIRQARLGKSHTPDTKKKISNSLQGNVVSESTKYKISKTMKKRMNSVG